MDPEAEAVFTVLGAGTLVPDARRASPSHHLRVGRASLLLDCGSGTVHGLARHGVAWAGLTHVVVSHFHNDHVGDLPALFFALRRGLPTPRSTPLTVVGPRGVRVLLERLAAAFGAHVLDPGFPLQVVELDDGASFEEPSGGLSIACAATPHTSESLAYRIESPWGTLGYTGDTGPSEAVGDFVAGVDVLVAECNGPDAVAADRHLTPSSLAALAERASPGLLVVVHVGPLHTPPDAVRGVAARYRGRVVAGADGLRVRLGWGAPEVDVDPPTGPI